MTRYEAETFGRDGKADKIYMATFSDQTEDEKSVAIE